MKISWHKKTKWLMGLGLILLFSLSSSVFGAETIKLGLLGPMKFVIGEHCLYGATLAVDEINKAGGVAVKGKKYQIELINVDSNEIASIPDAVSAMERLITVHKVDFITGGYNTEPCLALQEVVADYKKIWISVGTASDKIASRLTSNYDRYKYWFRVGPPNQCIQTYIHAQNLAATIDKVKEELGVKRPRVVAFLENGVWSQYLGGTGTTEGEVFKTVPKEDYELLGRWTVSRTATNVTPEMTAIKAANPHIIFNVITGPVGITMSKTWGELRIPAALCGMNVPGNTETHWQATNGMCNYERSSEIVGRVEITEKTIPFFNHMMERYKQSPLYIASTTYDGVYVLKEAIERAGSIEREAVFAALEKTDYRGVQGRIKFYPKDHRYPHDLIWGPGYVTWVNGQWRDGKFVTIWPDGRARLGEAGFKGLKYKGTVEYELPPWMVEYWKSRK